MKRHAPHLVSLIALLVSVPGTAAAQGFQNLNFEHPVLPLVPDFDNKVAASDAMPGWSAYIGGSQVSLVSYNGISLGGVTIGFLGPDSLRPAIQGNYAVFLQPGLGSSGTDVLQAAITQTGTVPGTTLSLRFYSAYGTPSVSFAGQQLSTSVLGAGPNQASLYGADISRFAGQVGELRFEGYSLLDAISLSTLPVPEPGTLGVLALGAVLLGCVRGRSRG